MMLAKEIKIEDIYDINYPCYISGIPKDSVKITHIPGQFEYQHLDKVKAYVIEAYKTKNKLFLYDCIPCLLWEKKICLIPYEKRIKTLHRIVTEQLSNFDKVIDLYADLVENPYDFQEVYKELKQKNIEKIRIMDVNGNYIFGQTVENELMEMSL